MTRLILPLLALTAFAAFGGHPVPYSNPLAPYAGEEYWYSAQPGSLAALAQP